MAKEIKVGTKLMSVSDEVEIIARDSFTVLAKVVSQYGQVSYDIGGIGIDEGREYYRPSASSNGWVEIVNGGAKQPRSSEEMWEKYNTLITTRHHSEEGHKAATAARAANFETKMWKVQELKRVKAESEAVIVELMSNNRSVTKVIADPRLQEAVQNIVTINQIISYVR